MRIVKNPLRHLLLLFFLDGLLAAVLIYLKVEASRENRLFDVLKQRVEREAGSSAPSLAVVLYAMHITHDLVYDRTMVPGKKKGSLVYRPPSGLAILMPGNGAFGSYSTALARLLDACSYPVRVGQMEVNGHFDGTSIVEARVAGRWIVLDPTYDLVFRRPDSSLAGFADLQAGWEGFVSQLPAGYDKSRRYEAIRYTSWNTLMVSMSVHDLWFYIDLFVFVLLNLYLYCGMLGCLPWQRLAMRRMNF